jgi:hypothetical protein
MKSALTVIVMNFLIACSCSLIYSVYFKMHEKSKYESSPIKQEV